MFPGIPSEKLLDKKFVMHAMDMMIIRDGKIKHEYHMENYAAAVHQMLNNEPVDDLGFEEDYIMDSDISDGTEAFFSSCKGAFKKVAYLICL